MVLQRKNKQNKENKTRTEYLVENKKYRKLYIKKRTIKHENISSIDVVADV